MTAIKSTKHIYAPPVVKSQLTALFGETATLAYQRGLGYVVRLAPERDHMPVLTWDSKRRPTTEDHRDIMILHGVLIGGTWEDWNYVKAWLKDNTPVKAVVVEGFWKVEQLPLPLGLAA